MDYSFLKLYDSINDSIIDDLYKSKQLSYYLIVQLLPDETYLQTTNYDGGISLNNDFSCYIVDGCDNTLSDITDNVFTEEYTDSQGLNQVKVEYVNLGVDYGGRAVHIKFAINNSNAVFYTRPIKITSNDYLKTYRFDYFNNLNLEGISYENSNVYQSIRLSLKFTSLSNKTEVSDYYQISNGNNISLRPLRQIARSYKTENIDSFTFVRLQELLLHNNVYIDTVRITNKPILEYDDRIGESNLFRSSFTANINDDDKYIYNFQIYQGLEYVSFTPSGLYVTGSTFTDLNVSFNEDITLNNGTITVYNSSNTIVETFTQSDMTISGGNSVNIDLSGTALASPSNDTYYVHITSGLVSGAIGLQNNEAISDNTTWSFTLRDADFLGADFNNSDFFTN